MITFIKAAIVLTPFYGLIVGIPAAVISGQPEVSMVVGAAGGFATAFFGAVLQEHE